MWTASFRRTASLSQPHWPGRRGGDIRGAASHFYLESCYPVQYLLPWRKQWPVVSVCPLHHAPCTDEPAQHSVVHQLQHLQSTHLMTLSRFLKIGAQVTQVAHSHEPKHHPILNNEYRAPQQTRIHMTLQCLHLHCIPFDQLIRWLQVLVYLEISS